MSALKNAKSFRSKRIAWVTGVLCVACCTAPFIGMAVGSATFAAFALYSEEAAIAALGATLLAYKYYSRRKAPSCDLGCGCQPASGKSHELKTD